MEWSFYVPLGLLGLFRWVSWLVRRVAASRYRPYRSGHHEALAIVVPVYREDPAVFRAALESWIANDPAEIICVVDATDTDCLAVLAGYQAERVRVIVTTVPGKRDALRRGWEAASAPLVALADSDTLWASDVARRVCEPFADPAVGGVGTRQNVLNPRGLWQRVADMYLDQRYFDENAAQTAASRAVSCLSGRTAVYRRYLLVRYADAFMSETFLGVPCNSGDDKRLTTLILEGGWATYMQRSARVWSTFPGDARNFFRQRLRWARNTWRSDLRALFRGWVIRQHPFLAFTMIDKALSSVTLLVSPAYLLLSLLRGDHLVGVTLVSWWMVSRTVKLLPHLRRRPSSILLIPAFIVVSFAMAAVKLYALATVRRQRWLTRPVAVVGGKIVRLREAS